ncbi:hypothetical protein BDZ91DRAFT_710496 [Kalaharituber pfeilii]|nr:hypothetical protein BDZ91DRAFT_710496 [Kalaharituber pfeilii]
MNGILIRTQLCSGNLSEYRKKLEEMLANGRNTEGSKKALLVLEKLPPEEFHQPSLQEERMIDLEDLLQAPEVDDNFKVIKTCHH